MNHNAFFESLKTGDILPAYLFEGTEEYIKAQALARLRENLLPEGLEAMNYTELVNPDADELIAAAETLPFMADKRLMIARDCDLLTAQKGSEDKLQAILDYLERLSPTTCLVFFVKGDADHRKKLYLSLNKRGATVSFTPMADAEAERWMIRTMKTMGKRMDATTAQKMVFTVGHDAALLKQEMEKLAAYAGERETVNDEDIDAVCVRSLECSVFQMVEAQASGRSHEACRLLNTVLEGGEDRFMVLSMLLRQYRILYHARCLMEEKTPQASLAKLLGIPPFAVGRTQAQARRYTGERLKAAYDYLFDLEYRLKSGRVSQDGSAETALFTLDAILNSQTLPL
ncbi:MAG: DNA polymerase III subunit delta [Eubacteriales bacterium]|nr:DNA polymerase III subunit delta [Eubacteriales bacterium]